jgi:hypothetical protein
VIILNANPNADALHPDAIYRLNFDNDGDLLTDIALSYVFSKPQGGKQTFSVLLAKGAESRSVVWSTDRSAAWCHNRKSDPRQMPVSPASARAKLATRSISSMLSEPGQFEFRVQLGASSSWRGTDLFQ